MMRLIWTLVVGMTFLGGAGCRHPRGTEPSVPARAQVASPGRAAEPAPNPRLLEQRAEAHARFMAGLCHELNGDAARALDEFHKAALLDPDNEPMVLDLSTRFILRRNFDKAAELLEKALEQPGASALLDTRLAFVYLQQGRTNDALRANHSAIKKNPRFIAGYQNLFHLYLQSGQTNEAVRILDRAAAVRDPDAAFLVELSEMYFVQHRLGQGDGAAAQARAKAALERAAQLNPTNFFVLQRLADGFTQMGDRKQAAAVLLKLQRLFPDLPNTRERLLDLYLRERDTKGAAEQLEGLIRENPTNPQAYYLLGILAFDDKRFQDAADHFAKTVLLNPDFEPAYYELAVCKLNLERPREALEVLDQARRRFKETFLSEYFSALAFMRLKDHTNAVQRLTAAEVIAKATDTNRLTHLFYFQLGAACERAGRWTEAEGHLLKCLQLAPDFAEALNYLGYMWAERGTNLVQARQMIEKALQQEPDNAAYLDSLGWVLFKLGQPREALKHIQRALDLSKEPDATLYDHLGDIYLELNEPAKARDAWNKALAVEPTPDIRRKLDRLKP